MNEFFTNIFESNLLFYRNIFYMQLTLVHTGLSMNQSIFSRTIYSINVDGIKYSVDSIKCCANKILNRINEVLSHF